MSGMAVREAVTLLRAAHDTLAGCDVDALSRSELLSASTTTQLHTVTT